MTGSLRIHQQRRLFGLLLAVFTGLVSLAGCSQTPLQPPSAAAEPLLQVAAAAEVVDQRALSADSNTGAGAGAGADLMASTTADKAKTNAAVERFDVIADNTPVAVFFNSLVHGTGVNLVLHPEVKGLISLHLQQVTLRETLEAVRDIHGYDFIETRYGVKVLPRQQQTRIYPIDYLNVSRSGRSGMQVSSGQVSNVERNGGSGSNVSGSGSRTVNSSEVETASRADFWQQLGSTLQLLIQGEEGAQVVVDAHAGLAIVRAMPSTQAAVEAYLRQAEISIRKQVLIETKILEITLNDGFQAGIDWNTLAATSSRNSVTAGQAGVGLDNADRIGGIFSLNLSMGDFTGAVELLQTQGDVRVLSSPRIATVNNQKAVIKVGSDEFFVTEVSTTTTTSTTGSTQSPDIELTPFFSGIALDVTPQISNGQEVILHVHPTVTEVEERVKTIELGSEEFNLPLAYSTVRETDSIIRAQSGQVVVIGGLMQNRKVTTEARVPLLGDIPLLGWLFRQQRQESVQSELVILIQPHIVDGAIPVEEIGEINRRFSTLAPSVSTPGGPTP
ncbi:pilus (MSHA type) biogenesis protein MshL [Candidatus Thalassolituus haligoni]|uniref:pilus (MSHA type) biogenesis protein MshL n=1 Tax=Candidatus Thalassolituus haligoni TaxID=3100113 RepID=UPI0035193497|tara:strand:- start:472 stop:2148 length:1677 start_codon:yes stop_codon:yes gene_type:complete